MNNRFVDSNQNLAKKDLKSIYLLLCRDKDQAESILTPLNGGKIWTIVWDVGLIQPMDSSLKQEDIIQCAELHALAYQGKKLSYACDENSFTKAFNNGLKETYRKIIIDTQGQILPYYVVNRLVLTAYAGTRVAFVDTNQSVSIAIESRINSSLRSTYDLNNWFWDCSQEFDEPTVMQQAA